MSQIHVPHAFFDPASFYNRLRAASPPDDRTIGYFSWLKKKRELERQRQARTPAGMAAEDETAERSGVVVIRLDQPTTPVRLAENSFNSPLRDPQVKTSYWVEFTLADQGDRPEHEVPCRVLLLEASLLQRLRNRLHEDGCELGTTNADVIRQLLQDDMLSENQRVAGFLSALPELKGTIQPDGTGSAEVHGLDKGCPNFDGWTIIVYDPRSIH